MSMVYTFYHLIVLVMEKVTQILQGQLKLMHWIFKNWQMSYISGPSFTSLASPWELIRFMAA